MFSQDPLPAFGGHWFVYDRMHPVMVRLRLPDFTPVSPDRRRGFDYEQAGSHSIWHSSGGRFTSPSICTETSLRISSSEISLRFLFNM